MTAPTRRILVAEDEAMISMLLEDFLEQLDYEVASLCMSGAQCQSFLDSGEVIDGAILDCNLADGPVWEVARRLQADGVPFMFASGDGGHGVPPDLSSAPVLGKPYFLDSLERSLSGLFSA
ncbi:MAG: response regulator [Sphingobium sp.]